MDLPIDPFAIIRDWPKALESRPYIEALSRWVELAGEVADVKLLSDEISFRGYCERLKDLSDCREGWRADAARVVIAFAEKYVKVRQSREDVSGDSGELSQLHDLQCWTAELRGSWFSLVASSAYPTAQERALTPVLTLPPSGGFRKGTTKIRLSAIIGNFSVDEEVFLIEAREQLFEIWLFVISCGQKWAQHSAEVPILTA